MTKKLLFVIALILTLVCVYSSCDNTTPSGTPSHNFTKDTNHAQLVNKIGNANFELSYSELYSIYKEAINHKAEYNCELDLANLLKNMLYGKWKDASDHYIAYSYVYEDYNNTEGSTWYGTNLPTSKISGNTYYYYTDIKDDKLIIGYEDKLKRLLF